MLVTDLKMPDINGLTLASAARLVNPAIGVILMTAYGSREVETEAEQLMIDGYLTKPFQMERLRDLIEKILQAQIVSSLVTASDDNSVEAIDFSRGNCSAKEVNVE